MTAQGLNFYAVDDGYEHKSHDEDGFELFHHVAVWNIMASDANGHRWVLETALPMMEDAEEAIERIKARGDNPANHSDWIETDPIYGSNAWDNEAEYGLACFEADCYNEPRPRW